jgi:hypothetical protein
VIDPKDGKIPWTPEVRERFAKEMVTTIGSRGRVRAEDNERGGDGPEDRPNDRCLGFALPIRFAAWETGGAHHRIVQAPGSVAIYYEYGPHGGAYRTFPLDGRPHLPPNLRQWLGDARGRWEGDTLVVDTVHFADKVSGLQPWANFGSMSGSGEGLHIVERFTRADANTITYRMTVTDPKMYTKPWTVTLPMVKTRELMYEYACHEGNYGLENVLKGARAEDRRR